MNTIKTLAGAAMASLLVAACGKLSMAESVRDLGFEVTAETAFSSDYLCNTLSLTLESGTEGEYTLNYVIDDDHTLELSSLRGGSLESGDRIDLSLSNPQVLLLPKTAGGTGTLVMEFVRKGVSRKKAVVFRTENAVTVRMDTSSDLDFSRVILGNRMGASQTSYEVTFYLDGEKLSGMKYLGSEFGGTMELDFARSESYTFELPYILTGEHYLKVDVKSALGSESSVVTFREPERKPTQLVLAYNDVTGMITMLSAHNPLQTAFDITVDITVRGSITYRHKQFIGSASPQTERFTESAQATARLTPGMTASSVDNGTLRALMDRVYSNTRTDASNAIGNGNKRTLHTDITGVELKFTIVSGGATAGRTSVTMSPSGPDAFPIRYLYKGTTWSHSANQTATIIPTYTVNGKAASQIHTL